MWLASAALLVGVARFVLTFRANLRMLQRSEREATTDALTGLGNRRALSLDLEHAAGDGGIPQVLALYDLDGFKSYNDAFGHVAGDALLERLGSNLATAIAGHGTAYRMGGDEFCVLARVGDTDRAVVARAAAALGEHGGRFASAARTAWSCSTASGPTRRRPCASPTSGCTRTSAAGAGRATRRSTRSSSASSASTTARCATTSTTSPASPSRSAAASASTTATSPDLRRAAALHDVGKIAIPDDILHAPRALAPEEWDYMRQHTVIGARIIAAAPELLPVADIVRSSHERCDGGGYPDRLAGDAIPLGARIVAVCDSFDAMTTDRAYRAAMAVDGRVAELERCAGSQFDPRVVSAFRAVLTADASARAGDGTSRGSGRASRRPPPDAARVQRRGTSAASAATRSGAPARCHAGSSSRDHHGLAARVADERRAGDPVPRGDVAAAPTRRRARRRPRRARASPPRPRGGRRPPPRAGRGPGRGRRRVRGTSRRPPASRPRPVRTVVGAPLSVVGRAGAAREQLVRGRVVDGAGDGRAGRPRGRRRRTSAGSRTGS